MTKKRKPITARSPDPPPDAPPAAPDASPLARWGWLVAALLGVAVFLPSLGHEFVWDDFYLVRDNPRIRSLAAPREILLTRYWDMEGASDREYRPIALLSFAMNWAVSGARPALYHATNILLHAGACAAAWALLMALFARADLATLSAALFAVHPAHHDGVAPVFGRPESLAALGFLGASILALKCFRAATWREAWRWGALTGLAAGIGIGSKESAVAVGPMIVALWLFEAAWAPGGRARAFSRAGLGRLAIPLLFSGAALLLFLAGRHIALREVVGRTDLSSEVTMENPFFYRIFSVAKLLAAYVAIFFYPFNPSPLDRASDLDAAWLRSLAGGIDPAWIAGFVVAPAVIAALWLLRRRRATLFGAAFFFVAFLVTSNLLFNIKALLVDRLLYLPSLGLCVILADLALAAHARLSALGRRGAAAALAMALSLWATAVAAQTVRYQSVWRDMRSLSAYMLARAGDHALAHVLYGEQLAMDGRPKEAIPHFQEAIRKRPTASSYMRTLGLIYRDAGMMKESQEQFEACLKIDPTNEDAIRSLSAIYIRAGRRQEAIALYLPGLKARPQSYALRLDYALALAGAGRQREAIGELRKILPQAPANDAKLWWALGRSHYDLKQFEEAVNCLRRARKIAPRWAQPQLDLARALADSGNLRESESVFADLAAREPGNDEARAGLERVRSRMAQSAAP